MTLITVTSAYSNFKGLRVSQYEYAYSGVYHQPVIFLSGTNHGARNMTGSVRTYEVTMRRVRATIVAAEKQ
jgi:hypothetical protein